MEDTTFTGGTITSPGNPALEAARVELKDIATNPSNPRHAGYHRGDTQVSTYLDALYKQAVPQSAAVAPKESFSAGGPIDAQPGETPEDAEIRARNEVILAPLRAEWGSDYERRFAASTRTMRTLFEGNGEMLDELGTIVRTEYGPKGEAAVLKLFAELEDLKQS